MMRSRFVFNTMVVMVLSLPTFCLAQTQAEATQAAALKLEEAQTTLAETIKEIEGLYADDGEFLKNLKNAHNLWFKFRQAELKVKYPSREPGYYGSMQRMCESLYLYELTIARIEFLRTWIRGIEEGDGCAGTVRTKD